MRAALPSALTQSQPWAAQKRGSSQALPVILDDDEETGSISCDAPDSSGPANELLTSSGDEQWSIGNEICADSGEQAFLEVNSASPVGLYSTTGLRGRIALPFAQGHSDAASIAGYNSGPHQGGESRDAAVGFSRIEAQVQQQQRLVSVLPAPSGSGPKAPLLPNRTSSQRLVALVSDVTASTSATTAVNGAPYGTDELTVSASPAPTLGRQSAATPTQSSNLPLYDQLPQYGLAPPQQQRPQPGLQQQRDRSNSVGRSRGVSFAGSSSPATTGGTRGVGLTPPPLPPPLRSDSEGFPAAAAAAAATGMAFEISFTATTIPTTRSSASSILEHRDAVQQSPLHSEHPNLQQQLSELEPPSPTMQPQPQPPPSARLPFAALRLQTANSQGRLRLSPHGVPPSPPPIANPDGFNVRQPNSQQQQQPWWGLPPPGAAVVAAAAAAGRLGTTAQAVAAPTAAALAPLAAARTISPTPMALNRQVLLARASAGATATADGNVDNERVLLQPLASPSAIPTSVLLPPQQQLQPPHLQPNHKGPYDTQDSSHHQQQLHLMNAFSAPLMRLPEATMGLVANVDMAMAAATGSAAAAPPPPAAPSRPGPSGRATPPSGLAPFVRARAARQSAPALGRGLQLPDLRTAGGTTGGGAAAAAVAGSTAAEPGTAAGPPGEAHISGVGVLAAAGGAGGPAAGEVPAAPEITLRPPKWLKPSAFQVTEQLRSGRLQELFDKLATVNCPTFLDLGGYEFSGPFTPAAATVATIDGNGGGAAAEIGISSTATAAAAAALGSLVSSTQPRHQTLRVGFMQPVPGASAGGNLSARSRYLRDLPDTRLQVLSIPPGQHITLYNATLLLTADQYILVGPGASLTLKGVEVLGCSREAARQSAAVRRRALSMAAAAAAASASTSAQVAAAVAGATVTSTAATGYTKLVRRTSSPGRTTRDASVYGVGGTGRRASVSDGTADGSGGGGAGGGPGLPPVRRRAVSTTMGGTPFVLSIPVQGFGVAAAAAHELVDPNEYVDNHGLVEVVGGYARISNCRIWPGRCQMALCVSDGGGCSLLYSTAGACCAAGLKSCLVSEQTTYDGGAAGCVSALHGARLGLTDCVLRYAGNATPAAAAAAAAELATAAAAASTAANGNACGCDLSIEARGLGTLAVLTNCDVTNGGVAAALAARLYLQSTRVADARGHGLLACDPGTALYVRDCRIDDCGRSAVVACGGAAVRVADATLAGSTGSGVLVVPTYEAAAAAAAAAGGGGGEAAVSDAAAAAPPAAAKPQPPSRSSMTLLRCDVSANAGHGAWVTGGGFLAVGDTLLYNNQGCGMAADGGGSMLTATGTRLIRNEGHGIHAASAAGLVLLRCCSTGNGRDGVAVEGGGTRAHLTRCECRENRESGLCVTGAAAVELSYSRFAANQHDGLSIGGTGSTATAHGCVLNGNVAKGAVVCMGGTAELSECAVHCNGSKSVQVSDEDSRLVLGRTCALDRQAVAIGGGSLMHFGDSPGR